jgi:hypothetical protein
MAVTNSDTLNECSVCLASFDNDEKKAVIFNCDTCITKLCSVCYDKISIQHYEHKNNSVVYKTKCPYCRNMTEKKIEDFNMNQLRVLLLDSIAHQAVFAEVVMDIKVNIYKKHTKFCNNLKRLIIPATNLLGQEPLI